MTNELAASASVPTAPTPAPDDRNNPVHEIPLQFRVSLINGSNAIAVLMPDDTDKAWVPVLLPTPFANGIASALNSKVKADVGEAWSTSPKFVPVVMSTTTQNCGGIETTTSQCAIAWPLPQELSDSAGQIAAELINQKIICPLFLLNDSRER